MLYSKLRLRKGCNNPKDLKEVLSVPRRRLNDGGNGGIVPGSFLGAEAPADFQFSLGRFKAFTKSLFVGGTAGLERKVKILSWCLAMIFLSLSSSAIRASLTFISLSRIERIRSILASSLSFISRVFTRVPLVFACTRQPLWQFWEVRPFRKAGFPKYLPALPVELCPVCFDTLSKSCSKVLFHTSTKVEKIMDLCKFNDLSIN